MAEKVKLAEPNIPSAEIIQTSFKQLSKAAVDLNTASDELGRPISVCEAALKKLNLGISAWAEFSASRDDGTYWWVRSIGYTQLKDRWGIALRTRGGHQAHSEEDTEESWPFNEAPRWMRIEAVAKLPDLLEALLKQAEDTTQKIRKKTAQANELAEAIGKVVADSVAAKR